MVCVGRGTRPARDPHRPLLGDQVRGPLLVVLFIVSIACLSVAFTQEGEWVRLVIGAMAAGAFVSLIDNGLNAHE